jgi:hypothetical protein
MKMIGLAYYADQPEWKNDLGETWSVARMIQDEIARPMGEAADGGLNRLLGLSYVVSRRAKLGQPIDGQYQQAQGYVRRAEELAFRAQNAEGGWGPDFLNGRSAEADVAAQLRGTGRVLEWLAVSLSAKQLEDGRVTSGVEYLTRLLGSQRYQWTGQALSAQEISDIAHALHALVIYDERVFQPADPVEKPQTSMARQDAQSR